MEKVVWSLNPEFAVVQYVFYMTDLDIDEFVRFFVLWKRLKAGRATLSWLGTGLKGHSVSIDP